MKHFLSILFYCYCSNAFNIDTKFPIIFATGNTQSKNYTTYFGSSIAINSFGNGNDFVLAVGAPKFVSNPLGRHGAAYLCNWNILRKKNINKCEIIQDVPELKKDMNFGSTILATPNEYFLICAHTWSQSEGSNFTGEGGCYKIPNDQRDKGIKVINSPTYRSTLGISATFDNSKRNIILGASGEKGGNGSVYRVVDNGNGYSQPNKVATLSSKVGYGGYSVAVVKHGNANLVATGAPRQNRYNGTVFIVETNGRPRNILRGDREYFGASLLATDLNNDGFTDLVVGAPIHSANRNGIECGRVHIFLNQKNYDVFGENANTILNGMTKPFARFGTSLASADINNDAFQDIIVGAPYEEEKGAIYLYLNRDGNFLPKHDQRISPSFSSLPIHNFLGFGISIDAGEDLDNNRYNDVVVGSHISEKVALLRVRPVAYLQVADLTFQPSEIFLNQKNCTDRSILVPCFNISFCLVYDGKYVNVSQQASIDIQIRDATNEKRAHFANAKRAYSSVQQLEKGKCIPSSVKVHINNGIKNKYEKLEVVVTARLVEAETSEFCQNCAVLEKAVSERRKIGFNHGCVNPERCIARIHMVKQMFSYSNRNQPLEQLVIDKQDEKLVLDVNISNTNEIALSTVLLLRMSPFLQMSNLTSLYNKCNVTTTGIASRQNYGQSEKLIMCNIGASNDLDTNSSEKLRLIFDLQTDSGPVTSGDVNFALNIKSNGSDFTSDSKINDIFVISLRKSANISIEGNSTNDHFVLNEQTAFSANFYVTKHGPSTVDSVAATIMLPVRSNGVEIISLSNISKNAFEQSPDIDCILEEQQSPLAKHTFVNVNRNGTLHLNCINLDDCLKIICKTKNFKWKAERRSFTIDAFLNLADLQVAYGDTEITSVNISLYATAEIEDGRSNYVASLSNFDSKTEVLVKLRKQSKALGLAEIPTWVLILSASVGILLFFIVLVILIKKGFFKRKRRDKLRKLQYRQSLKLDWGPLIIDETDDMVITPKKKPSLKKHDSKSKT